ncbi:zinc finger protein 541 isoform X2 [Osmerus eperlanus]|uniref:zinc finger protein 541 isoform X2 n=1 Tax=Osmerus eperlanus TaxID=29151 RepID=UPI002E1363FA
MEAVSGLTAPTPLAAPPPDILQSEPWMGSVTADIYDQSLSEEYSLTVDLPVRDSSYECSLCLKMFGTANSLSKHLLTHQQERPHVCSICQRAFKRHDHLSGHMLTHQKRKQFPCAEPGCRKSYYDSHSLKRHYMSQHISPFVAPITQCVPPPAHSAKTQWEPVERPAGFFEGSADTCNYHSLFLSPPQARSDKLQHGSDYSAYASYNSNESLPPPDGSLVKSCLEPNLSQPKSVLVLAPWRQGSDKGPCNDCTGELHPSQWNPDPQVQEKAQTQVHFGSMTGLEGPGTQSWDSRIDIPVSDLQALEEIMSYDPCSGAANAGIDSTVMPFAATDIPSQSKQLNVVKQTYSQMSSEGKPQDKLQLYPFENTKSSACSISIIPAKPVLRAAHSFTQSALPNQPNPGGPPPPILPPVLYSMVKSKACLDRVDMKKRSERRKKLPTAHLPAPPLPPVPPASTLLAPRRPRPRPLHLVSPSQVAMASFSDSSACQHVKAGNTSVLGEGPDASEWIPNFPRANKASGGPSGSSVKIESHSPESEDSGPQGERSPAKYMALSPLVIPVSVPVTTDPDLAYKEREDSTRTPDAQGCSGRVRGNRRLDFMKSLIIPPPAPRRLPAEEAMGGAWGRGAGCYTSQLRSPMYLVDHLLNPSSQPPPYTPPPMLSPLRPGTGLYFSTLPPLHPCPPPSTYTATLDGVDGISLEMDDTVVSIKPRINVGQRFQAEIPPTRNVLLMLYDEHPAQLVWAPWGDTSTNTDTQKRVEELLDLCCSSVLPGGGTNTELALHCLHEVQGDILAALDLLLMRGDYRSSTHPLSDYHYAGSDHWTPLEKRLFCKALLTHEKDFQLIHSELQTKSVSQCVEYYYGMKKIKKFKPRSSNRGSDKKEGAETESSPEHTEDNPLGRRGSRRRLLRPDYRAMGLLEENSASGGALEYTCRECGRVFDRVKSRSAHMKSHRKSERQWLSRSSWSTACPADEPPQEPTLSRSSWSTACPADEPPQEPTLSRSSWSIGCPADEPTRSPHTSPTLYSSRGILYT